MNRATALFLASVVVALLAAHLLRDTPGFVVRGANGTYEGDIVHYVYWTRLVTLGGIQAAYGGTWPETYAVYPPLPLYAYQAVGNLYRLFEDPQFDPQRAQESLWLREAIKIVAFGWHLLTGLAIYALVRRRYGAAWAGLAGSLYVANPATLYDVAHWAQPDGAHSVFSVLAMGTLSWGAMALAALAKPQACVLVPLLAVATLKERGARALLIGVALGGLVSVVLTLPFLLSGRLGELLSLPGTVSSVMPVVSADAHNLWRLVAAQRGIDPLFTPDASRLVGPLTYRVAAALLVAVQLALTYWLYWTRRVGLAEAAALSVLGWFVFTTQAHENHLFFAVPLLALAMPGRPSLVVVYGALSITLLLNMALHDQLLLEVLGGDIHDPWLDNLRLMNAALNVLCWLGWALIRSSAGKPKAKPYHGRTPFDRMILEGRRACVEEFSTAPLGSAGNMWQAKSPDLIPLGDGLNFSTPLDQVSGTVVPTPLFFVRSNYPPANLSATEWALTIDGRVRKPLTVRLADLQALPTRTEEVWLECAGNGRTHFQPPAEGNQWNDFAVSNAVFTGVPLRALLEQAEVAPEAVEVVGTGADSPEFQRGLPLDVAMQSDVLLAFEINGDPIPGPNGGPVRLIVPRWAGIASIKWPIHLELVDKPFQGYYNAERYIFVDADGRTQRTVRELPVKAIIAWPGEGQKLTRDRQTLFGFAWSGFGEVERVDVSTDGCATWTPARLRSSGPLAWARWELDWTPRVSGSVRIAARATDSAGNVQPAQPVWNKFGYEMNAIAMCEVLVSTE